MLQGQRDLATVSSMILSELAPLVSAQHGVFYTLASLDGRRRAGADLPGRIRLQGAQAPRNPFRLGEGLVGQCAQEKERILLTEVPGDYVRINSGLGESAPLNIIVLPILFEGSVRAVVELASFSPFSPTHQAFLDQLTESIGLVLNTIEANTLTENLLKQSQSQAQELQSRQEELSSSNEDLERPGQRGWPSRTSRLERKNQEVELAKRLVEEKAEQLAVSSKYKSEFFSNMSHELRTPLNSLLILAGELEDNQEQTLTETPGRVRQRHSLLGQRSAARCSNDILDLAKVESGTVTLETSNVDAGRLRTRIVRDFEHVAKQQGLAFSVELAPGLPDASSPIPSACARCSRTCSPTRSSSPNRVASASQIGLADAGWSPDNEALEQCADR